MMSVLRLSSPLLLLCGVGVGLLIPAEASADKVSNAMAECQGKALGEACALAGRKGACVARSFERPNGMSKRWIECSPGKEPDRNPAEKQIDAAGPVGVLPSIGAVEGDAEPSAQPKDVEGAKTTPTAKVEPPDEGAKPAPPSPPDKVQSDPNAAPADATSPTSQAGADPSAAPEDHEPETRGGCRLEVSELPLGLTLGLAGLLLMAGRRREPSTPHRCN